MFSSHNEETRSNKINEVVKEKTIDTQFELFNELDLDMKQAIISKLLFHEVVKLSLVSKECKFIIDETLDWNEGLKLEFQTKLREEAKKIFMSNPAARIDKYLLLDKTGENYVRKLVPESRFEQESLAPLLSSIGKQVILEGLLTVHQFIELEAGYRFEYFFPLLPNKTLYALDHAKNTLQAIREKFITIDDFLKLNGDDRRDLHNLFTEDGLKALRNKKISVSAFLNIPQKYCGWWPRIVFTDAFEKSHALEAITKELVTVNQVESVAKQLCEALNTGHHECIFRSKKLIPVLELGLMTLDQFIAQGAYPKGMKLFEAAVSKLESQQNIINQASSVFMLFPMQQQRQDRSNSPSSGNIPTLENRF